MIPDVEGVIQTQVCNFWTHLKSTFVLDKVNDWEKIYDLPAHASTITDRNVPSSVDVQRRLQLFEKYAKRRSQSAHQSYEASILVYGNVSFLKI